MATQDDHRKRTREAWLDKLQQRVGTPIGDEQTETTGDVEEGNDEVRQEALQAAEGTDADGKLVSDEPVASAPGYHAFEADFRGHHESNAAQRRGPYQDYRAVYRYGYDLGTDARYRDADWSTVERDARPRWEERNPATWQEFEATIRYAWDKARGSVR